MKIQSILDELSHLKLYIFYYYSIWDQLLSNNQLCSSLKLYTLSLFSHIKNFSFIINQDNYSNLYKCMDNYMQSKLHHSHIKIDKSKLMFDIF
jgi:hypothetical protein